jgi:DNA-binding transcriptional ArsR family regulator
MSFATVSQGVPAPHPAVLALQRTQQRVRELEGYLAWEDQLFANPCLSATHKLTLRATRRATERGQTKDERGRTRVNLGNIAEQIGVSPDTVSRSLTKLEEAGAISKETRHEVQPTGELWSRVYVALNEEQIQKPKEIAPPTPRNHGGARYICQQCGSHHLKIRHRVTLVCKHCHHESLLKETEQDQGTGESLEEQDAGRSHAPPTELPPTGAQDAAPSVVQEMREYAAESQEAPRPSKEDQTSASPSRNLPPLLKPVSPPLSSHEAHAPSASHPDQQAAARWEQERERQREMLTALDAAAALLVAIAGPTPEHIEMCRSGDRKYKTVHRPLTQEETHSHLAGGVARGGLCSYPDGQTRGLCWDTDNAAGWQRFQEAAERLVSVGYLPLLEWSPAGRGGHLWVVFDDLVDAGAARQHIYTAAPVLAEVSEYWPGPPSARHWNKVRLPGGRYVRPADEQEQRPAVNAWCRLVSVADGETALEGGVQAAQVLLAHQTPALLVPALAQEPQSTATERDQPTSRLTLDVPAEIDTEWQAKYGTEEGKRLWFAFPAIYAAAWWNARHSVDELLPSERNGYGLATWRGEREGSVAKRGGRWADFGQSARRPDGTPDTGDALELQTRLTQTPKPDALRQVAKELIAEARAALEGAARSGQPIPAWVEEIITHAGRAHYARLCADDLAPAQKQAQGGLTGFSQLSGPGQEAQGVEELQAQKTAGVLPSEVLRLIEQHQLQAGLPCQRCGCALSRDLCGEWVCCRCLPPRGYHTFAEEIERLYPRKTTLLFGASGEQP